MEERILQPTKLVQGPTAVIPSAPADAPGAPTDGDAPALRLPSGDDETDEESDEGEFEFEFPFVSRDSPAGTAAAADELFVDGRIRPFYPVFGRGGSGVVVHGSYRGAAQSAPTEAPRIRGQLGRLFLEETRARNSSTSSTTSTASSSSSAATNDDRDGLEGAPPESYCLWTPGPGSGSSASAASSPRPPRKSSSTGSMVRWRRISELVVGRSHSDGKEKFMFLPAPPPKEASQHDKPKHRPSPASGRKASSAAATEVDAVAAAHRIAYIAKGSGVAIPGSTPRRTFLPYREELVGFFANVNGISRSHHHPF